MYNINQYPEGISYGPMRLVELERAQNSRARVGLGFHKFVSEARRASENSV